MTDTPNLGLPFIAQSQAQKEVTHNEALTALDAIVQLSVHSRSLSAPPGSPAEGDRYIVAASPTGAWAGEASNVAAWQNGAWAFYAPVVGWTAYIEDERQIAVWADGAWVVRLAGTAHGGAASVIAIEEEVTLTGASVSTSTAVIPNRGIVLGVASRTTLAISGATSYSVGVAGTPSQFGSGLGVSLGSNNVGVIGPTAFYASTPILISAAGGNFTGGKVRVILYVMVFTAPTS